MQALRIPLLRYSPNMPLATVIQTAFRPICENAGLPWKRPGINHRMIISIVSIVVFYVGIIALAVIFVS